MFFFHFCKKRCKLVAAKEWRKVIDMRLRNISGSKDVIAQSPIVIHDPKQHKGDWRKVFGNDHPIRIEIGMGKGRFIYQLAERNPEINYIGIEKYSSVLLRALQKMEQELLPNLLFIRMDAEEIAEVFGEGEVDRIYLNFSDPWPKDRHAKRRLPSLAFLDRYAGFLKKEGILEFKTDNYSLFQFGIEEAGRAGWEVSQVTYDLHHDEKMAKGNIMTEYEEKFSTLGNPIYKYIIKRPESGKVHETGKE